jgi:hypothetical protein
MTRECVEAGGLLNHGPDRVDMFQRGAIYVDKVLKGANPADLPVEQPTKFDFGYQSQDRQGARHQGAGHAARPSRRGDRIAKGAHTMTEKKVGKKFQDALSIEDMSKAIDPLIKS